MATAPPLPALSVLYILRPSMEIESSVTDLLSQVSDKTSMSAFVVLAQTDHIYLGDKTSNINF